MAALPVVFPFPHIAIGRNLRFVPQNSADVAWRVSLMYISRPLVQDKEVSYRGQLDYVKTILEPEDGQVLQMLNFNLIEVVFPVSFNAANYQGILSFEIPKYNDYPLGQPEPYYYGGMENGFLLLAWQRGYHSLYLNPPPSHKYNEAPADPAIPPEFGSAHIPPVPPRTAPVANERLQEALPSNPWKLMRDLVGVAPIILQGNADHSFDYTNVEVADHLSTLLFATRFHALRARGWGLTFVYSPVLFTFSRKTNPLGFEGYMDDLLATLSLPTWDAEHCTLGHQKVGHKAWKGVDVAVEKLKTGFFLGECKSVMPTIFHKYDQGNYSLYADASHRYLVACTKKMR